jgi:NAD(P)-dependent dehydrogenase (short-subunit alcohol dehydrogenase family)
MTERVVLVTGVGSGFGLATALHLADLGFTVIGLVPDQSEGSSVGRSARAHGTQIEIVYADLADPDARAHALEGRQLYAVINNAGYMNAGLMQDVPIDEARQQLEAMVLAPIDLVRRSLPHMLARGEGRVVNITSAAVHASTPFTGWYQASKAALRELTNALRLELVDTGIDVIDIEPGGFETRIWSRGADELRVHQGQSGQPEAYRRPLETITRFQSKMGEADDVAKVVGTVLTTAHPRAHIRVGPDAGPLRIVSDLVPHGLWDRAMAKISGVK